jgi:hypothetical protein
MFLPVPFWAHSPHAVWPVQSPSGKIQNPPDYLYLNTSSINGGAHRLDINLHQNAE